MSPKAPHLPFASIDRLFNFVTFSETLNFTVAARKLGISQPALFTQIALLSEELAVTLYIRNRRDLQLTKDGERVAAFAREMIRRSQDFVADLYSQHTTEPLTLCAGAAVHRYLLAPVESAFLKKNQVPLRLLTRDTSAALDAVRLGEADVAVTVIEKRIPDVRLEKLRTVSVVLVMNAEHPLAKKSKVRIPDLHGHPLIVPPLGQPFREQLERTFLAHNCHIRVALEANGWDFMLHFASIGVGLTLVNDYCPLPSGLTSRPMMDINPLTLFLVTNREKKGQAQLDSVREEAFNGLVHALRTTLKQGQVASAS